MRTSTIRSKKTTSSYLRKTLAAVAMLALASGVALSAGSSAIRTGPQPWESKRILVGMVSDSTCGAGHITRQGDPECTRLCVKLGAEFALVTDRQVLVARGHAPDFYHFAGRLVVVTGVVRGDTITVESVAPVATGPSPIDAHRD